MSESSGTAHKVTLRRLQSWQSLNGVIGEKHSFLDSFHDRLSVANCGNPQGDLKETADLTHFYWIYWSFLDSSHEKRQEVQEQPSRWLERPDLSRALGYVMWLHNAQFFKNFLQKKTAKTHLVRGQPQVGDTCLCDWLTGWAFAPPRPGLNLADWLAGPSAKQATSGCKISMSMIALLPVLPDFWSPQEISVIFMSLVGVCLLEKETMLICKDLIKITLW